MRRILPCFFPTGVPYSDTAQVLLAMLAWRIGAALDRALVAETFLALRNSFSPSRPALAALRV